MNEHFAVGKINYLGSVEILYSGIESIGDAELISNFLMGREKSDNTIIIIPGYNRHLSDSRITRAKELIRRHKSSRTSIPEQRKKQRIKIGPKPKPKRVPPENYQNDDYYRSPIDILKLMV